MNKMTNVYQNTDKSQTLTIVAAQGKSAINVKASVKTGKGKGAPKAVTGGRGSFQTLDESVAHFDMLNEQAVKAGWTRIQRTNRNAFTTIPGANPKVEEVAPPKAAKAKK